MTGDASNAPPKLTDNQDLVLRSLKQSAQPLTAYEILDLPEIRQAGLKAPPTIYRALARLEEHHLIHRIESLNAFIACSQHRHHAPTGFIICNNCKAAKELDVEDCRPLLAEKAARENFAPEYYSIEIAGLCGDCRPKSD